MKTLLTTLALVLLPVVALAQGVTTYPGSPLPQNIMAAPYNAKCDGSTDDTAAFLSATLAGGAFYIPAGTPSSPRACEVKYFEPGQDAIANSACIGNNNPSACCTGPSAGSCAANVAQSWDGGNKYSTFIDITQTNDTTCNNQANNIAAGGAIQIVNVGGVHLSNLTLRNKATYSTNAPTRSIGQYTTAPNTCFVNQGNQPTNFDTVFHNVDLVNTTGSASGQYNPIALFTSSGVDLFTYSGGKIGSNTANNQWGMDILGTGTANNVRFDTLSLNPNFENLSGGVYFDAMPDVYLSGYGAGVTMANDFCNFSPNCIGNDGTNGSNASEMRVTDIWASKKLPGPGGSVSYPYWTPNTALNQGDLFTSGGTFFTGNCTANSTDITNVSGISPSTQMWVGESVTIQCGTAGANQTSWVASVNSPTEFHTQDNMTATETAADGSVPLVNGSCYRATTNGTTGTSQPTFSTTPMAPITDGTESLIQYGSCAVVYDNAGVPLNVSNSTISGPAGIINLGGGPLTVNNVQFASPVDIPIYATGNKNHITGNKVFTSSTETAIGGLIFDSTSSGNVVQANAVVTGNTAGHQREDAYSFRGTSSGVYSSDVTPTGLDATGWTNLAAVPSALQFPVNFTMSGAVTNSETRVQVCPKTIRYSPGLQTSSPTVASQGVVGTVPTQITTYTVADAGTTIIDGYLQTSGAMNFGTPGCSPVIDGTPAEARTAAGPTLNLTIPANAHAGDFAIMYCIYATTGGSFTTPSGFTLVPSGTKTSGSLTSIWFEKNPLVGGDLGATAACTYSTGTAALAGAIWTFKNGPASGEVVDAVTNTATASGGSTCNMSAATPLQNGDTAFGLCASTGNVTWSAFTNPLTLSASASGTGGAFMYLGGLTATPAWTATISTGTPSNFGHVLLLKSGNTTCTLCTAGDKMLLTGPGTAESEADLALTLLGTP